MKLLIDPHNRLFELARSGKRLPHLLVALIFSTVFMLTVVIGGSIVAIIMVLALSIATGETSLTTLSELSTSGNRQALTKILLPDTALEQTIVLVLSFGPIFLILWAWLALVEKRSLWTIGMEWRGAWFKYARGLLVGLLMFVASIGLSAALGYIAIENGSTQPHGLAALGGILLVFLGWTVQGPAEEALTRGWLMPVIGARYKPWLGVIISAAVFAFFHSLNSNLSLIAVLNLFPEVTA